MKLNAILMVLCTILYSLHTCLIRQFKTLYPDTISSDLIVCYQYLISILLLLPFVLRRLSSVKAAITKDNLPYLIGRCSMIFIATLSWFYALSNISAVNCIAISCMTPIFILILAKTSLKEMLDKKVISLAIVAFIGAIIVIGPDPYSFNIISLFAVFTAFLWAFNSTFTKKYLSPKISSISIFFVTAIILSLIALPYVLIKPHTITLAQTLYLTGVTLVFDTANIILIWVFSRGKISLVAPFDFLRVVFTTIISSVMLNDSISTNAIVGIVVILIGNSLAMAYQNGSRKIISQNNSIRV